MFIDQENLLNAFCKSIETEKVIAIDTEFKRETTYYPQLCLIQIAAGSSFAIIDALAIDNLNAVNALLQNPNIQKVMHSCSQDCEIFYQQFGALPKNIFDTQIAACVTGLRSQISFKDLIYDYCQLDIDKSETRSDWTKRPLSQQQLNYAKYDVVYLLQCYPLIKAHLIKLKRLHWLSGDFKALENTNSFTVDPSTLWKKVKGHQSLPNHQLIKLNQLAIWREHIAQSCNKIRRKTITDPCLLSAAKLSDTEMPNHHCLQPWTKQAHYLKQLNVVLTSQVECNIKQYQPIKLNPHQKNIFDEVLIMLDNNSEQLGINLKNYISNSKLKKRLQKSTQSSTPCLAKAFDGWQYYAIYQPINNYLMQKGYLD